MALAVCDGTCASVCGTVEQVEQLGQVGDRTGTQDTGDTREFEGIGFCR